MTGREKFLGGLWIVAFASLSACDDAVSHPPEGALSMRIDVDPNGENGCSFVGADSLPNDPVVLQLSANTTKATLDEMPRSVDGKSGDKVSCSVKQTAPSAYEISANLQADKRGFSLSNATVAAGVGANATISWLGITVPGYMTGTTCALEVDEQVDGGGAIKLTFNCPQFVLQSMPNNQCTASGTVVLERCDR